MRHDFPPLCKNEAKMFEIPVLPSCPGGIMMRRYSADFWAHSAICPIMMLLWVSDVQNINDHTLLTAALHFLRL